MRFSLATLSKSLKSIICLQKILFEKAFCLRSWGFKNLISWRDPNKIREGTRWDVFLQRWDFNFQTFLFVKWNFLSDQCNQVRNIFSLCKWHLQWNYNTSLFWLLTRYFYIFFILLTRALSFFYFNFTVRHVTSEQMKAFKYYKKNSMSVELLKNNHVQKCHFRVKNKVRKGWYTAA